MGFETIYDVLKTNLHDSGFEVHPFLVNTFPPNEYFQKCQTIVYFQISWYNSVVDPLFRLTNYDDNTVAFLVISTPSMFERTFLPYALNEHHDLTRDPIDCCVKETIQSALEVIDNFDTR